MYTNLIFERLTETYEEAQEMLPTATMTSDLDTPVSTKRSRRRVQTPCALPSFPSLVDNNQVQQQHRSNSELSNTTSNRSLLHAEGLVSNICHPPGIKAMNSNTDVCLFADIEPSPAGTSSVNNFLSQGISALVQNGTETIEINIDGNGLCTEKLVCNILLNARGNR